MLALVTGASSGIGRDMARELSRRGYDLISPPGGGTRWRSWRRSSLPGCGSSRWIFPGRTNCRRLHELTAEEPVDVLINNAGFGVFGAFEESDLERELEMLDINIRATHMLTKLYLRDFLRRGEGMILNVSSSAAFLPGPLLSSYYASKAYVLRLTEAIHEELRRKGSAVYIGALCPGPVKTEFDRVAGVHFSVKGMDSGRVARYALDQMFRRRMVIIPGAQMKLARQMTRLLPQQMLLRAAWHLQERKARRY